MQELTFTDLVRRQAGDRAGETAFTFLADGEVEEDRRSFAELDREARGIAAALLERGLFGERALLLYPPGLGFVSAFLGCLYAGVVAVPAYPPGSARSLGRIRSILDDARPRAVLTTASVLGKVRLLMTELIDLESIVWLETDALAGAAERWRRPPIGPGTLAFLQYTSGSTATPKGVEVSHANLLANEAAIRRAFDQSEASVILGWLPLYHDMGLIGNVLQPLYVGAPCVLMSPVAFLQRPARWLQAITRYRATTSGGPNFAYDLCARKVGAEQKAGLDLASWRVAFNGAEPVRAATLARFAAAFADCGFDRRAFYPCYGMAEATLFLTGGTLGEEPVVRAFDAAAFAAGDAVPAAAGAGADSAAEPEGARRLVGCGRAWGEQRILVVEPESRLPCAPGRVGEIWAAGPSIAGGYWGNPAATLADFGARLAADPAAPREGPFLRTGDLGFLDERGELFVTGRLKDLIILRGRNLYPQDIEGTVERAHQALRPGCGAAFSVDAAGEERLVVVQEVDRRASPDEQEEALAAIRTEVAREHEAPLYAAVLIRQATLPKTSSGKVQRRLCRQLYLAGELATVAASVLDPGAAPDPEAREAEEREAPAGAAELSRQALLALAAEERPAVLAAHLGRLAAAVLGRPAREVPRDRPLTALGLDSLAAAELKQAVEAGLGLAVPLGSLLEGASADSLAVELLAAGETAAEETLEAGPARSEGPLSPGQRALWFLDRLAPGNGAYHLAAAARISAAETNGLDREAFSHAVAALCERHAALRATFPAPGGQPIQRLAAAGAAPLRFLDAGDLPAGELPAHLAAAAFRPFDLAHGPLLRIEVWRLEGGAEILLFAVHHAVADFAAVAVIADELGRLYAAARGGGEAALAPLPVTYLDYVRWQGERLAGEAGRRLWAYWQEALAGPVPDLDLPTDRPRPAALTFRGGTVHRRFAGPLAAAVRALAERLGATPFMAVLAGFAAVLGRYARQGDFAIGSPAAGRPVPALAGLVGYFVNPLVLRAELAGEPGFAELVGRMRRRTLAALEHQELPFALLTERLRPVRDPGRSPLFQVMLTWPRATAPGAAALAPFALGEEGARLALGPLTLTAIPLPGRPAPFDLDLGFATAGNAGDEWLAALGFNADLFDPETAARLLGHLETLLAAAVADPTRALSTLPLLAAAESEQILRTWNDTAAPYPADSTVVDLFLAQAGQSPDRIALAQGDAALAYGELARRAQALAGHLAHRGVSPETRVAVHLDRTLEMAIALWGILAAGAAYVPLDPAYPAERLALMLEDCGATLLLTETRHLAAARALLPPADATPRAVLDVLSVLAAVDLLPALSPTSPIPENLAYLIYTSGSTGRPKGVAVPHRGLVSFLTSMARRPGFTAADALLSVTTLSFDIFGLELYLPLATGGLCILASRAEAADGFALGGRLAESGATAMQATPATWRLLLATGWAGQPEMAILSGGEALPRELAAALHCRGRSLWNLYGPTETTIWSAVAEVTAGDTAAGPAAVSLGHPIANTALYVLDPAGQPQPAGIPGELVIGGHGVTRGYLGRPDLTAERFVPDPWGPEPGARLYQTGDLARFTAGGALEFLGRLDHQVKIRGFRIELGEVEAALAAHPAVAQAVAVAQPEPGGGHRLVAYLVFRAADRPDGAALRRHLAGRLPDAYVPSLFVPLDRLPLTPNGKVDRKALPAPGPPARAAAATSPRTALERRLTAIWREVLGLPEVGADDNFFDLGGHSLKAAEVHARLEAELGRTVPLVDLFRHPTVAALARHLARGGAEPAGAARPSPAPTADPARPGRDRSAAVDRRIAIVGMAGRFPGAAGVDELWRLLAAGEEGIAVLSPAELAAAGVPARLAADPAYVPAVGALAGADTFDAAFFGFSPREAELLDPQHRLFLECAWAALEDAGYDSAQYGGRIGLYAGVGINTYLQHAGAGRLERLAGRYQAFIANDKDFVPTRASYKLDLTGPSVDVQTACSTSLVALHLACQALLAGDCEMALVGGVAVRAPQTGYLYEEGGIASPDGHCRAFDAAAAGTVFGNGVGLVVVKPYARALADGDRVRALILGTAINNDGARKVGYTAPGVDGQARVIADALAAAGVAPAEVSFVEAHGTGTPMGDPIEVAALAQAFGDCPPASCALGSVKTNLGHLDTAAGIAGLIKTVLALEHRQIPPTLHFARPNPRLDLGATPFFVNAALLPWETGGAPRRAGVSSFGIGGTNAHAVLEEAPAAPVASARDERPVQLLALSARTPAALEAATANLRQALAGRADLDLADAAHTLRIGRRAFAHRRVLVCRDRGQALERLETLSPEEVWTGAALSGGDGCGVAFLFPGQGAQHAGMGRQLYATEPAYRRALDECAELAAPHLGLDLRPLLAPEAGGEAAADRALARTELAQPALFAVEVALARLFAEWGVRPQAMLGHSLGEYVAAHLAGVFDLPAAVALVCLRGRLMGALPGGAMLGVQLPEAEIVPLLGPGLSLAAVNGPRATVVSGPDEAVAALARQLAGRGVQHRPLHTSHAFHSAAQEPILADFEAAVRAAAPAAPRIPILSNLTGRFLTAEEATDPGYWARHLRRTVRFADGAGALLADPDLALLEVGPGNHLATLARQNAAAGSSSSRVILSALPHPRELRPAGETAVTALGRLWLAGVAVDWQGFVAHQRRRRVGLPGYPFERRRFWLEGEKGGEDIDDGGGARLGRREDPADWLYGPLWRQGASRPALAASGMGEPWLLLSPAAGPGVEIVDRLAAYLVARGRAVTLAQAGPGFLRLEEERQDLYALDFGRADDFVALLAELAAAGRFPGRIVHGLALTPAGGEPEAVRGAAFESLLFLAQAFDKTAGGAKAHLAILSHGLKRVAGREAVEPGKALLSGLVPVIPQEISGLTAASLDLPFEDAELADELIADLAAEIASPDLAETAVAWRGGERWVETFGPLALPSSESTAPRVVEDGIYLITGGLGGLGLELAAELAQTPGVKLALLGRRALPPRESWDSQPAGGELGEIVARIRRLEAQGATVLPVAADVADPPALAAAIGDIEAGLGGPIRGVVHAAGVPGGGLLAVRTAAEAGRVLAPKVAGTLALWQALAARPLDFFVLCSSINAVVGGFGQADYAAANAFCDAFAQAHHRRRGPYVAALAWDRWEEVGMAARSASPLALWQGGAAVARADAGEPTGHPLLGRRVEASAERTVYRARFDPAAMWVLAEHRIAGRPTVPGTTYLEMARAALAFAIPVAERPVEIRAAVFMTPLAVDPGETVEVATELLGSGDRRSFRVISQGPAGEREHARGVVAVLEAGTEPAPARDVAALLALCSLREVGEGAPAGEFLVTGPRWQSLRRLHLGPAGESLAELDLDPRFAGDLADFALHPALLDVAAGAVQLLGEGHYLPLAYERLIVHRALPARGFSHFHLKSAGEVLTADLEILDGAGEVAVEIEGFAMKRVSAEAVAELARPAAKAAGAAAAADPGRAEKGGILPAEGRRLFGRLLAVGLGPRVVISTRDLAAVIEEARHFDRERLAAGLEVPAAHARPDVSSSYEPPADDLERRVAAVWQGVLGIERVGIHDNFFELGGTSLTGVQLVAELKRQMGAEIPTVAIFEAPTIASLVRYLRPRAAPGQGAFAAARGRAEKKIGVLAGARRVARRR